MSEDARLIAIVFAMAVVTYLPRAAKAAEALRQHVLMSRERTIRNYVKYSERKAQ
jgi:hypothetical protein